MQPASRSPAAASGGYPTAAGAPWREPVRGGHPNPSLDSLPGIEMLRRLLSGAVPSPPLSHLTGLRAAEVGDGTATFTLPLGPWLHGPDARVSLGPLTLPADAAMASAAITRLPPGVGLTTSELSLRQLRPAPSDGLITARARVVEVVPPAILIEATLTADDGTLVARGSSLCVMLAVSAVEAPAIAAAPSPAELGADRTAAGERADSPDPWQRPAPAGGAGGPTGPIGLLTGLREVSSEAGRAIFALPATPWLCAPPPGRVQGGAVATLAEAAMTATTRAGSGAAAMRPVELKLNYLRPLASDGREAVARAELVHPGRRIAVATAAVRDADERLIAIASGSAIAGDSAIAGG